MKSILFVCMGNICRSPMAEAMFRNQFEQRSESAEFTVDSAATSRWEVGNSPHHGTQKILKAHGISSKGIRARQITTDDFYRADYIIGMDRENVEDLMLLAPEGTHRKIHLYLDLVPEKKGQGIPDPWYTGDFDETYSLIEEGLPYWLTFFGE
ncbi:low molecular weight protein-tyrosine-phosphatase [Enterococcus sp. AZ072]|uniref:low molecular weight protein-tyrosine-phosphatase n=1 Tax=unclassified Enterococcus TaxID=2608891 RepID=UPI003D29F951